MSTLLSNFSSAVWTWSLLTCSPIIKKREQTNTIALFLAPLQNYWLVTSCWFILGSCFASWLENWSYNSRTGGTYCNDTKLTVYIIHQTRKNVFDHKFQTPRRELKIGQIEEYVWWTLRRLEMWSNTVLSVDISSQLKLKLRRKRRKKNYHIQTLSQSWFSLLKLDEFFYGGRVFFNELENV